MAGILHAGQQHSAFGVDKGEFGYGSFDQGGISKKDFDNLFSPYFQTKDLRSRELNKDGHGLGLSISRDLAEKLGYKLSATSK